MKNKFKEKQRITQRIAGKGRCRGIYIPHLYDDKTLTWWEGRG